MSNACECDRCGEYYSPAVGGVIHDEADPDNGHPRPYMTYGLEGSPISDLCRSCYDKLLLFLDGRDLKPKPIEFVFGDSTLQSFEVTMTVGDTKSDLPDFMESNGNTNY